MGESASIYQSSKQSYQEGSMAGIGTYAKAAPAPPSALADILSNYRGVLKNARESCERLSRITERLIGPYPSQGNPPRAETIDGNHLDEFRGIASEMRDTLSLINEKIERLDAAI